MILDRHACRCSVRILFLYLVTWHENVLICRTSHSPGTCECRLIEIILRYNTKKNLGKSVDDRSSLRSHIEAELLTGGSANKPFHHESLLCLCFHPSNQFQKKLLLAT